MNSASSSSIVRFGSFCLALAILPPYSAIGQESDFEDRLARLRDLTSNSEIILMWTDEDGSGLDVVNQRIYDLDLAESNLSRIEYRCDRTIQTHSLAGPTSISTCFSRDPSPLLFSMCLGEQSEH